MRIKEEIEGQLLFLRTLTSDTFSIWEQEMVTSLCEDVQDKLDGLNGVVASSLQSPKLSDGCVEDVQANGRPNGMEVGELYIQPSGTRDCKTSSFVQGLLALDKQN
jgi:hypothetical protein